MSVFPLLFSNWWEDLDQPHSVRNQSFGLGLNPEHLAIIPSELYESRPVPRHYRPTKGYYYRPWDHLMRKDDGGLSTVKSDKDNFSVSLDVQQFADTEISVKVVDKFVVVEGNHEEKQDEHGWISRKFTRKYLIPEQCDIEKVESRLSSDGVLTITVPRKEQPKIEGKERVINIQQTGKPAIQVKETEKPEEKK